MKGGEAEKMFRVEDKFLCSERDMLILESRMKVILRPDAYAGKPSYQVTSLYFDNREDTLWRDAEDGVSFRNKYRIRIYNNIPDPIKLEVKYKAYNRVYKKSKAITREEAARLIAGDCLEDPEPSMDSPVTLFNLAIRQDLLRPRSVIDYHRSAYIFVPGNVRITFDRNIRASSRFDRFLDGGCPWTAVDETDRILEVKYDEFLPGFIAQLLETGNMIQYAYSKYRLGRERLEGFEKCL